MSALGGAKPGDVFKDRAGALWKVTWYCETPTVGLEPLQTPRECREDQAAPRDQPELSGGIYGAMWDGFVKLEPKS